MLGRYMSLLVLFARRKISFRTVARILKTRASTRMQFGKNSPFPHMRAWCCPICITKVNSSFNKSDSGRVLPGDWDLEVELLLDPDRSNQSYLRRIKWLEDPEGFGETSIFELEKNRLLGKGKSVEWIEERYRDLNSLRLFVRDTKSLPKSRDSYREFEFNGIPINIGRHGNAISSGGGSHRLALSQYFRVKLIPVEVFVVHSESVSLFKWQEDIVLPCRCSLESVVSI